MEKTETRWVIVGVHGLYTGQYLTRRDALDDHCFALGKTWKRCYQKGDRAIKAKIKYTQPKQNGN